MNDPKLVAEVRNAYEESVRIAKAAQAKAQTTLEKRAARVQLERLAILKGSIPDG